MAERRMFAKTIIDSDAFLDMPLSTQALYFHLSMRADDDGFLNNPKKIMRMVGASEDELKVLMGKKFLLGFESGVIVIKHWKIHNYIRSDRYKETLYHEEKLLLEETENKSYTLNAVIPMAKVLGIPNDNQMDTQVRLGKVRLGKDSIVKEEKKPTQKQVFSDMIFAYTDKPSLIEAIENFVDMRKAIKAKLTTNALKLTLSKLDKMANNDQDKIEILNQSVMNSWKGIFELKNNSNNKQNTTDDFKESMVNGILGEFLREG